MTIEYKYIPIGDGEFEMCDACNSVAPLHASRRPDISPSTINSGLPHEAISSVFCEICVNTVVNNTYTYPRQYPEAKILQTIAAVGNIILDKLTDRRKSTKE